MSRNTNGGEVSKPPGPGEDTVDLAELLDGKVLEAGKRPSKRVTAGGSSKLPISRYREIYINPMNRNDYEC